MEPASTLQRDAPCVSAWHVLHIDLRHGAVIGESFPIQLPWGIDLMMFMGNSDV
jgi:hypothetical protein